MSGKYLNLMNSATENHSEFKIEQNLGEKSEGISKFFSLMVCCILSFELVGWSLKSLAHFSRNEYMVLGEHVLETSGQDFSQRPWVMIKATIHSRHLNSFIQWVSTQIMYERR